MVAEELDVMRVTGTEATPSTEVTPSTEAIAIEYDKVGLWY
jgi:hypothetical protein